MVSSEPGASQKMSAPIALPGAKTKTKRGTFKVHTLRKRTTPNFALA